jgi:hypothetical protein
MAARFCAPCSFIGHHLFPEDRPSPIFTTFSIIVNSIFLVWSIVAIAKGPCDNSPLLWTILGLASSVVNIVFAIYLYTRFTYKIRHESTTAQHAAWHLFLYDWGVCLYLLFTIWLIVWLVFAGITYNDNNDGGDANNNNNNSNQRDECNHFLKGGIILFAIYLVLGALLMCCSVCTEFCRQPRWSRHQQAHGGAYPQVYATPVVSPQAGQARPHRGVVDRIFGSHHRAGQPTAATQPYGQQQYGQPVVQGPPPQNPHYQV